jgi:hypothetical protein
MGEGIYRGKKLATIRKRIRGEVEDSHDCRVAEADIPPVELIIRHRLL